MENSFESIPQENAENTDEKLESARRALGDIKDETLKGRILEHPELVDLLAWVDGQGRTASPGFYGDIKRIDQKLAGDYLRTLAERESVLPDIHVDRVTGGSGMDAEAALNEFKLNMRRDTEINTGFEREKTEDEVKMVDRAIENVNRLREKHGQPPVDLGRESIRMLTVRAETNDSEKECGGFANAETAMIYHGKKEAALFDVIQHELMHLGQFSAINVRKTTGEASAYRKGMQVEAQKPNEVGEYPSYLLPLNEAITEENARRLTLSISEDDQELGHIAEQRKRSLEDMETIRKRGNDLPDAEFLGQEILFADIDWQNKKMDVQTSGYTEDRQAMWWLFDKIHEKNPDAFSGKSQEEAREEMFDMVTKASLDGNILPFGRLMNETFGLGTFRNYGHLQTAQEILAYVSALEKVDASKDAETEPASDAKPDEEKK